MDRQGALARLRAVVSAFAACHVPADDGWCVAVSGGADSLALAAAASGVRRTTALIVDHGLQAGSRYVAEQARAQALSLGCESARVIAVDVGTAGGPEGAARAARYRALDSARDGAAVLLGHTLDDQAETVLLGLGRGSGPRSVAGMRPYHPPWCRPLLGIRRAVTEAACEELGVAPWHDPHNRDPRYTRVRLRHEVLPLLEDVLGGGVAEALARTAVALREDTDLLDRIAADALPEVSVASGLDARALTALPAAVRRRVVRSWLLAGGACDLTDIHIRAVDDLVARWRGQGGVAVPSALRRQRLFARRDDGVLGLHTEPV